MILLKNLYYANKNLKKLMHIVSPVISKCEIDINLRKTNIYFITLNKKKTTLVINTMLVYISGINWRNNVLTDITCVDSLKLLSTLDYLNGLRFTLKYTFTSLYNQDNINFYINLNEKFSFFSLEKVLPASVWLQREIWDMFGIFFLGSSDLRRILTDYGFKSFPLRADFPVFGNLEIYYDIEMEELLFKKVDATQENRFFGYNKNLFWF